MPSEQRLHPASLIFAFARSLKAFVLPYLLVLFTARRSSTPPVNIGPVPMRDANWEAWAMVLLVPSALAAIARYLSFHLRYETTELVIRSGIIFRNERHVPYARIQNLDAVQNVFHRLFGVIEVRVETGSGKEPEATISVIPAAAFEDMRRRVFQGRTASTVAIDEAVDETPVSSAAEETILHLPLRELILYGWLENRGLFVISATIGLLWQFDLLDSIGNLIFGDGTFGRSVARDVFVALVGGSRLPLGELLLVVGVVAGVVAAVQLLSIGWAIIRLYDFRLTRVGEDLRSRFGLFTRVTSTIPLRRVQTMTIREGPIERLANRVSVRVETAGGGEMQGGRRKEREWLAPIVRRSELSNLILQVVPELDLESVEWHGAHPRAFRRAAKRAALTAVFISAVSIIPLEQWLSSGQWALGVLLIALPWTLFAADRYVRHLGWAASDEVVLFKSGWLWRHLTVARAAKVQAVSLLESPFDRRAAMSRVRVDTAGASERSHRVDIPYLPRDVAHDLYQRLATRAASTAFRW
jgi:putative membrane protein